MRIGTVSLYTLNSIPFFGYPIELLWTSPQRRRGARHRSCETSGPWCPGVSKLSHAWIDVMMFPFWLMLFVVVCLYTCTEPRSNTANLSFWNLDFWPLKLPFLNILDQFAEHLDFSYSFHPVLLCHICHILGSCRRRRQFSWPPSGAVPIAALTSLRHRGVGRWGKAWSLDGTLK